MKVGELGEFSLLRALELRAPPLPAGWLGPGDDAALVETGGTRLLVTTDSLVEGVHFRLSTTSCTDLGYKALAVNVSDIAAMGGRPLAAVVGLALPGGQPVDAVRDLYRGLQDAAQQFACPLVGGDTCAAPQLSLAVTVLGVPPAPGAVTRGGARRGDDIYVSGTPGDAALGLVLLERPGTGPQCPAAPRDYLVARQRRPTPRLELASRLGQEALATAMIDVSDGLLADLDHILEASRSGATVAVERLPLSPELQQLAPLLGLAGHDLALAGGEDYELLFTAAAGQRAGVVRAAREAAVPVTRIGVVEAAPGLRLTRHGAAHPAPLRRGFDHFTAASA